jgi:hypothetical protein
MLISHLASSSNLKKKAMCFSETSVRFQACRWVLEGRIFHNDRFENFRLYNPTVDGIYLAARDVSHFVLNSRSSPSHLYPVFDTFGSSIIKIEFLEKYTLILSSYAPILGAGLAQSV